MVEWVCAFCRDVTANFVGGLAAGGAVTALIGWWVGKRLRLWEVAREQRRERRERVRRALGYLDLISKELPGLVEEIPTKREQLKKHKWGKVFPIPMPVWDVVGDSPELVALLERDLLRKLAKFYGGLAQAKQYMPLLARSWFVTAGITHEDEKRRALVTMVADGLNRAEKAGSGLVEEVDKEIERLKPSSARMS